MKSRLIISIVGFMLLVVGLTMILPMGFALFTGETKEALAFVKSILITSSLGLLVHKTARYDGDMTNKEGVLIGALGWLIIPIFGCLPYLFSGALPGWFDAYFEAVSGFTTTGATVIDDVEAMAGSILLWRSFTQWLGGMGILLFCRNHAPSRCG